MNAIRLVFVKKRNIFFAISMCLFFLFMFDFRRFYVEPRLRKFSASQTAKCERDLKSHNTIVERFFEKRQNWQTSNLGAIMFKNLSPEQFIVKDKATKTFVVLIWKYFDWLKNRHVFHFKRSKEEPDETDKRILENCSVKNCNFVGDDIYLNTSDAIVIHMQRGEFPIVQDRNRKQRWIFLSDESPRNTFTLSRHPPKLSKLGGIFNWTMTYRSDSDVPVPYGRTVPRIQTESKDICSGDVESALAKLVPFWEEKQFVTLAMVMMSNCHVPKRNEFLRSLRTVLPVDVYGRCSDEHKDTCPGHFRNDCRVTKAYLFYLVLENASCRQYLTEKCFQHGYSKGAIPVIMGPPLQDCEKLLPPNSFLHVDNHKSIVDLAEHMKEIAANLNSLLAYHEWRKHFVVTNEHGYFGTPSYHLCRVCEALNYNDDEESIYDVDDLKLFFNAKISCDVHYGG